MKKLLLIPLSLFSLYIFADMYENEYFVETTPGYYPSRQGQPSTSTYYSNQPLTPQQADQQRMESRVPIPPGPTYVNPQQHPYGPPGSPSMYQQRPSEPTRTLPPHPYGPPGRLLSEIENNYNNNSNNNAIDPYSESSAYRPYYESGTYRTAEVEKPSVTSSNAASEMKNAQKTEGRDKYKTEADRLLNQKIREALNGGYEDSFPYIMLITSDGAVVIEGTVPNIEVHEKLERNISKIQGVKSVTNNATVKSNK